MWVGGLWAEAYWSLFCVLGWYLVVGAGGLLAPLAAVFLLRYPQPDRRCHFLCHLCVGLGFFFAPWPATAPIINTVVAVALGPEVGVEHRGVLSGGWTCGVLEMGDGFGWGLFCNKL